MMRKAIASLISILTFVMCISVPSAASDIRDLNEDTSYVAVIEDDAGLIIDTERVMESMKPITEYGNVMLKTLDENDDSAAYFAEHYLHDNFGKSSSVIFLIDMDNRKVYIFSDGAMYKTITRSKAEVITDNIYRYATKEDYDSCAVKAFEQINTLLEGHRIAEPMHIIGIAFISILLGLIICFIMIWSSTKRKPVGSRELIRGTDTSVRITEPEASFVSYSKTYSPVSSGGGGGSSGGGGGSSGGGGGGGGGSSGGGGGHSF
ncbi:MAG: TPM domain-containing protein [Lachnospiraceae bacterium]|nr:TPM domain-containing protein [Lachnospiraceae bacterium]